MFLASLEKYVSSSINQFRFIIVVDNTKKHFGSIITASVFGDGAMMLVMVANKMVIDVIMIRFVVKSIVIDQILLKSGILYLVYLTLQICGYSTAFYNTTLRLNQAVNYRFIFGVKVFELNPRLLPHCSLQNTTTISYYSI